jgi:GST-like protein
VSLVFYFAPMSSATPVAIALRELEVPHERLRLDLAKQETRRPEFRKLNPNGKVPTLVVDGTPMFEALAILQWLGDRFGVERGLWPAFDELARLEAVSWSTWAYVTYVPTVLRYYVAGNAQVPEETNGAQRARAERDLEECLDVLESRLAERSFLLGDTYSLVDLVVGACVAFGETCGASVARCARVGRWLDAVRSRPAFQEEWASGG